MTPATAAGPSPGRLADALLIPPFAGQQAPGWVLRALAGGLAGVTVFGPNIGSSTQLAGLIGELRGAAAEPVIAIDEEGGDVTRLAHQTGSAYPGNAALGAVDDPALTRAVYAALGADLAALGVNLNLAPSVDVNTAAGNPVIGTRSFGADAALVARHAAAAVAGLQSAGVAACAKHFPGHGSTTVDSHHALATVSGPMELIWARDLPPFAAAIKAGVRAVMPGHLRVPGLTGELPASLSAAAQTGLLRGELGFEGVIVSDALEMRAVSEPYGIPEAAVMAVAAGTDLLCFGRDTGEATYLAVRNALVEAVRSGRILVARIEESAARVAGLRHWATAARESAATRDRLAGGAGRPAGPHSWPGAPGSPARPGTSADGDRAAAGLAGREQVGLTAARRAILVTGTLRPLSDPVLAEVVPPASIAVGTVPWGLSNWVRPDSVYRIAATGEDDPATAAGRVAGAAAGRSLLIVVRDAHRYPDARSVVQALLAARPDAVLVEMGLPVWRATYSPGGTYVATFGATRASSRAVAEILGLRADQEVSADGPDRP